MPVVWQSTELPAPPEKLFDGYLNSRTHSAITGDKAVISAKANSRFSAFDGMLLGRTILVIPKRLIVQNWRSSGWKKSDPDSILVLAFSKGRRKGTGRIDLLHLDVPAHDFDGVTQGWRQYYWTPWRAYLTKKGK